MLTPLQLTVSFVFTGLSLGVLALVLTRRESSMPTLHFAVIITAVLAVAAFTVALRLWGESHLAAKTLARAPALTSGTQASTRTGVQQTDCESSLTATHVATYGASRLCHTARHTEDPLRHARQRAEEGWW
jgi:hypothetical protein